MSTEDILRRIEACEEAINKLCDRSLEHKKNISNCAAQILTNDKNIWTYLKKEES